MRLLYFTRAFTVHDYRFLKGFRSHGVHVGYLALQNVTAAINRLHIPTGVKVLGNLGMRANSSRSQLDAIIAPFERVARTFAPNVVLAGPITDCGYITANANLSCPWVAQSWAFDVFWENHQNNEKARCAQLALRSCSALFADCEAVVARCEKIAGRSLQYRFIMPWGIDLLDSRRTRSREAIRRVWGIGQRMVFLHTRGLEPVYGVETLLKAFRKYQRTHPEALLVLASDGSLRPIVERFCNKHALHDSIMLIGEVRHNNILDLFCGADCYVSCAASDGTSVSLLEAMAAGLPPIVSDAGGNLEWIQDGKNGWLVPVGDFESLTRAMNAVISLKPDCRRKLTEQNRRIVRAKANWSGNFRDFLIFLKNCTDSYRVSEEFVSLSPRRAALI